MALARGGAVRLTLAPRRIVRAASRPRTRRAPLRVAASAAANGAALALTLALLTARLVAAPPDPALVADAVGRAERALGGRYDVSVGRAGWTLEGGTLGLELGRVRASAADGAAGVAFDSVVAELGLGGALRSLHLRGLEAALPPARPGPIDLAPLEAALRDRLAPALAAMRRLGLRTITVDDIRAPRVAGTGKRKRLARPFAFPVGLSLATDGAGGHALTARLRVRDAVVDFSGTVGTGGDLHLISDPVPLSAIWSSPAFATDAPVTASLSAGPGSATSLDLAMRAAPLRLGAETATLDGFEARTVIDGGRARIVRAEMRVGGNRFALAGAVDAYRAADGAPAARFALMADEVTLAPADIAAPPVSLAAAMSGTIDFRTREIALGTLTLEGEGLAASGSARIALAEGGPAIALDLRASVMPAGAVAALWPSWIAGGARGWLAANVRGGALTDATMSLDLPAGRLRTLAERPMTSSEVRVAARFTGASTRLFGELPPLDGARGTLRYAGTTLSVALEGGEARTPQGTVPLAASTFALLDTSDRALPASFDLAVSGEVAALGALADAAPIGALRRAGFTPDELAGTASGRLTGRIALREPERRDWALDLDLDRVALLRALEGRRIAGVTGRMGAGPDRVWLDAAGTLDGVKARFDVVEPIALPVPSVERRRRVDLTLERADLAALSPAVAELVDGPITVSASIEGTRAVVEADLGGAHVSLPWVGWSKGAGVPATARLTAVPRLKAQGGGFAIEDLVVDGPGFGAQGSALIDARGLSRLTLTRAALSRDDDLAVDLRREGGGYDIEVTGRRVDARGILAKLDPRGAKGDGGNGSTMPVRVVARLDAVRGHGGVEARGVDVLYAAGRAGMERVSVRASLDGGGRVAVDGSTGAAGQDVFVTTDDLGGALRFLDLYGRVRGGVLTASLGKGGDGAWMGDIAAAKVEIRDEPKLRVMASKVSSRGQIDGSRVRLSRASVGLRYADGALTLTDGIVRGPEIGAVVEGTLIDRAGRISLTGTFLPAYGLNRIFGEVPLLGAVLGNGRDKGLIGLTFRLSGQTRRPQIEVNPLSMIAPGVLRRVFEYR